MTHAHTHTHTHAHIHTHAHTHMHMHIHMHTHTHKHTSHMYPHMHIYRRILHPKVQQNSERSQRSLSRIPKDCIAWAYSLVSLTIQFRLSRKSVHTQLHISVTSIVECVYILPLLL